MPDLEDIERLLRPLLHERSRVVGRKKWYETIEEIQKDLDAYLAIYKTKQPLQERALKGRTPQSAFKDGLPKKENAKMKPTTKAA